MTKKSSNIAQELGIQIVHGQLAPGCKLPSEVDASFSFGVSRQAYREALLILASKGLIEQKPRAGTVVSPRAQWHTLDPEVLLWIFDSEKGAKMLASLFEIRAIVEPSAAAFAAIRRTEHQLLLMNEAITLMQKWPLASPEGLAADIDFHQLILEASQNEFLQSFAGAIGSAVRWVNMLKERTDHETKDAVGGHAHVLIAIRDQDAEAARQAMAAVVNISAHELLELWALSQPKRETN